MRIVIDLQGAQGSSRHRGIGRYCTSLAKAMASNAEGHEILIALNGRLGDDVESIRADFADLLPPDNIRVWFPSGDSVNATRRKCDELAREAFLAKLKPDIVHVASLFEGLGDTSISTIGSLTSHLVTAVTLYDLIPYIYPTPYLDSVEVRRWYMTRVDHLRRADLLLGISGSASNEAVEYLGFSAANVVNISSAADEIFKKIRVEADAESELRRRLGLQRPFLMYTGGIDYRKNIEGLIRAYAALPEAIRKGHQLAVVCSVNEDNRRRLTGLAQEYGLSGRDFVLTGFVSDQDLVLLYNLCKLFVFASWHEGFGLPILEAMHCGAPVIAADSSSLPEVVGRRDALFAPRDDKALTVKMAEVLTNDGFRGELANYGQERAKKFSWGESARKAIAAFEEAVDRKERFVYPPIAVNRRPRLAFVSPLPPERSGIAVYSSELLPELSRYYEIDVITDQAEVDDPVVMGSCAVRSVEWFAKHHGYYERIVYQFGNSHFHSHMFDLLRIAPGVVVLHDFYLSGVQHFRAVHSGDANRWPAALYSSHGFRALAESMKPDGRMQSVFDHPCNYDVLCQASGVVVHSRHACSLADEWFGEGLSEDWVRIPLLRAPVRKRVRADVRRELGIGESDFLICSYGHLAPSKQSRRLLDAWLKSSLSSRADCHLAFVGENDGEVYGQDLLGAISAAKVGGRVKITGWTERATFQSYLEAADMAVQLRTMSRGETSAAVLDCMNYGLATIVNANGSMQDLDHEAVRMLPDEFEDKELIDAIESLYFNSDLRAGIGARAKKVIATRHAPSVCARAYAEAIERFQREEILAVPFLVGRVADNLGNAQASDMVAISEAMSWSLPPRTPQQQLLVDLAEWQSSGRSMDSLLDIMLNPPPGFRLEPIRFDEKHGGYWYARSSALQLLKLPTQMLRDEPIDVGMGDYLLKMPDADAESAAAAKQQKLIIDRGATRLVLSGPDNSSVVSTLVRSRRPI